MTDRVVHGRFDPRSERSLCGRVLLEADSASADSNSYSLLSPIEPIHVYETSVETRIAKWKAFGNQPSDLHEGS